jgi:hypothetical protein
VLLYQVIAARWILDVRMVALDATMVLTVVSGLHYAWLTSRRGGNGSGTNGSGSKANH